MDDLKKIASELQFWARRYADDRMTYVVDEVNRLTERLILKGVECQPETTGQNKGSIWAFDGDSRICTAKVYIDKYGLDGKKK